MTSAPLRYLGFAMLALLYAAQPTPAQWIGGGVNAVSGYIDRDTKVSGPSVQPSAWIDFRSAYTLLSGWSSIHVSSPRIDAVAIDSRTGSVVGTRGWLGAVSRIQWTNSYRTDEVTTIDSVFIGGVFSRLDTVHQATIVPSGYRAEIGIQFLWFNPPYRPSVTVVYDAIDRNGLLSTVTMPYTVRLPWLPPATFIPELTVRAAPFGDDRFSFEYFSFTGMFEVRKNAFTFVPIASVVPKGSNVSEWILWGGLHIGAAF